MRLSRNPMGYKPSIHEGLSGTFCFLGTRDGVTGGSEAENEHFLVPVGCQPASYYIYSFTVMRILSGRCLFLLILHREDSRFREVKHLAQMLEVSQGSTLGLSEKHIILPFSLTLSCWLKRKVPKQRRDCSLRPIVLLLLVF